MIKNYLLLALKVLRRKPFYTFVSLFGISFTLMILMLVTSMADGMVGANQPLTHRDRLVFLAALERQHFEKDTVPIIDAINMDDGQVRFDTTYDNTDVVDGNSTNPVSYVLLDNHLRELDNVSEYTFFTNSFSVDGYIEGRKFAFASYYTDASYWKVFNFEFIEGRPYSEDDVREGNKVAVLTKRAAERYFGKYKGSLLGKEMVFGNQIYRVQGLVERPLSDNEYLQADVWLPLTTSDDPKLLDEGPIAGPFVAAFLTDRPRNRQAVKQEIQFIAENYQMPPEEEYFEAIKIYAVTFPEHLAIMTTMDTDERRAMLTLYTPVALLLLLFITLPLINLINLNTSRIYERQGEIGVRKAFGARSRDILSQFVLENLIVTFIGGVVGIVLAVLIIRVINQESLLGNVQLALSPRIFVYYFFVILLFGLLSGVLPAYRMSRTNVATALR